MRRIIISANSAWNLANFRLGLMRYLRSAGYEVIALAPADGYESQIKEAGFSFFPLPIEPQGLNPISEWKLFNAYKKYLGEIKPIAVLLYTIKPNIYGSLAAAQLNIPVINNVSGLGRVFIENSIVYQLIRRLYRFAFRKSNTVFFQNEDDRTLFLNHALVKPAQTYVLPGSGVDLNRFSFKERNGDHNIMVMPARLLFEKGVAEFIEASSDLKKDYPKWRFQLCGQFAEEAKRGITEHDLLNQIDSKGLEYVSFTDQIENVYLKSTWIVLPSYREGTARVLLEAAASGRPLITSDAPGCGHIVNSAKNGFVSQVRSAKSLKEAMKKAIECSAEDYSLFAQRGRSYIETHYDEELVFQGYLARLQGIPK
jgi:glycosyltransferase involved in cell wall biosynthesis